MITSPDLIIPLTLSKEKVFSVSSEKPRRNGIKPHSRFKRLRTDVEGVNAKIGQSGRHCDRRVARCPVFVLTISASAPKLLAESSKLNSCYP